MSNKTRLDVLLVERGMEESRQRAQADIMSGIVFVKGQKVDKPGTAVANDAEIEIRRLRRHRCLYRRLYGLHAAKRSVESLRRGRGLRTAGLEAPQ